MGKKGGDVVRTHLGAGAGAPCPLLPLYPHPLPPSPHLSPTYRGTWWLGFWGRASRAPAQGLPPPAEGCWGFPQLALLLAVPPTSEAFDPQGFLVLGRILDQTFTDNLGVCGPREFEGSALTSWALDAVAGNFQVRKLPLPMQIATFYASFSLRELSLEHSGVEFLVTVTRLLLLDFKTKPCA